VKRRAFVNRPFVMPVHRLGREIDDPLDVRETCSFQQVGRTIDIRGDRRDWKVQGEVWMRHRGGMDDARDTMGPNGLNDAGEVVQLTLDRLHSRSRVFGAVTIEADDGVPAIGQEADDVLSEVAQAAGHERDAHVGSISLALLSGMRLTASYAGGG